jgi:hypothetical protein
MRCESLQYMNAISDLIDAEGDTLKVGQVCGCNIKPSVSLTGCRGCVCC